MQQSDFSVLITNVSATASQAFAVQCGEFGAAISDDNADKLPDENFNASQYLDSIDFGDVLDTGYNSLESLKSELEQAWKAIDSAELDRLLAPLPGDLPDLTHKLAGTQLKQWVEYALATDENSPFYTLHKYLMSLFRRVDDDVNDVIREAIAFDQIDELDEHEILPEHVHLDDLVTAATIQSFNAFKWLVKHANLDDCKIADILENFFDDADAFEQVYKILSPSEKQKAEILNRASSSDNQQIIGLINSI